MMNTHKMHGTVSTFVFIAVLAGSVMASSCSLFFIDKDHSSSGGAGSLTVSLVYEDAMARTDGSISSRNDRTVVPSLEANAKAYVVSCSDASGKEVASVVITSLDSCVLKNLPAGSFTVTARAYSDATLHTSDRLIAQGSANVNLVQDGSAAVSIVLLYLNTETGSGNLSFSVQWPDSAADSIKWYLDGNASAEPSIEYGNPSVGMRSAKLDKSGLSSGSHYLIIEFFLGTTHVGYAYEAVYICDNATSSHVVQNGSLVSVRTFTEAEIASTGKGASVLVISGGHSSVIALGENNASTSFIASLSTSVTAIPFVGEMGQAMMYSWNNNLPEPCISGTPLSLAMKETAVNEYENIDRDNTLILTVKSPSGGSPVEYSITMRSPIRVTKADALAGALSAKNNELLNNNVILEADIMLTGTGNWTPVGSEALPFTGTFNGNGHTISGLIVNNEDKLYAGLFGVNNGIIENVKLENPSVITTNDYSGGLAGQNNGLIRRCSVIGSKPVKAMGRLGGLVGINTGTITESYTSIPVEATSWYVGGLVGTNGGTIIDCYATGSVSSPTGNRVGGLAGELWASCLIKNSYATGKVTGASDTGGLVGYGTSVVTNGFYDTTTTGLASGAGTAQTTANMKLSGTFSGWDFTNTWDIDGSGVLNGGYPYLRNNAPELVQVPSGSMTSAQLAAILCDSFGAYQLQGDIVLTDPWTPLGSPTDPFTGIFNGNGFTISGLTVDHEESSAGLFGINNGTIENVNIENASIKCSDDSCGVLAGQNNGVIRHCSVSGSSPVQGVIYVGGLVGINRGIISESYSTVPVLASSFSVGGLVGRNEAFISNCYATGSVTSTRERVGGLVGHTWKNSVTNIIPVVEKSFAIGKVTGVAPTGGLVGYNEDSTISKSFYNATTTGMSDTDKGSPKTTIQMRTSGTYTDWDFINTWAIDAAGLINNGYPYLRYFGSETVTPPVALSVDIGGTATPVLFTNSGGITLTADRNEVVKNAYLTDKDKKLVTSDSSVLFTGENDFTIMGWFRIDSYGAGYTYFFYKSGTSAVNYGVVLGQSSETSPSFGAHMSQQGVGSTAIGVGKLAPEPELGTWYHVAMVYSTDKIVTLYVDGVSQGTSTAYTGSTATGTSNSFYFGAFNGAMSDLKIFNSAKTQTEIQTLMNQ